tara:strand:- start:7990 stop:8553 length:564 start_codon:yes stop_codon:yes gene_type:complete
MIVKRGNQFRLTAKRSEMPNVSEEQSEEWPPSGPIPFEDILTRQLYKESRFNPQAESSAGARGLAQITPITETHLKNKGLLPEDFNAFNPEHSKLAQKVYMDSLMSRDWNKGSEEVRMAKALAAYNFGPTATVRVLNKAKEDGVDIYESLDWIEQLPLETRDYIKKILGYNDKFESEFSSAVQSFKP